MLRRLKPTPRRALATMSNSPKHRSNGHSHTSHAQADHGAHDHCHYSTQHETEDAAIRRKVKGKERADQLGLDDVRRRRSDDGPESLEQTPISDLLDEAIHTSISPPLSSSLESSFGKGSPSPISQPAQVHYPSSLRAEGPKLLSQLTRTTLPTASMTYRSDRSDQVRQRSLTGNGTAPIGESSTSWQMSVPTTAMSDEPFPDLDPTTGLPLDLSPRRRDSATSDVPSLHLQRTITDLLVTPTRTNPKSPTTNSSILPSFPSISLPRMSLPSKPNFDFGTKSFSTSSAQDDWGSWASGWWTGNKGKVDDMMSEDDTAATVEEEKEKLRRKYRTPKNPVVFCHGLLGFDYLGPASLPPLQISHWRGIREVLESNGVEVLIARVPATSSIRDRAQILADLITEKYAGREVNLVGHSMGGLDCRYLVSQIKPKTFTPISLTTISTPHRGSPFADYVIDNVIGRDNLPSLLGLLEAMRLPQSGDGTAFSALGTNAMRQFNHEVVDSLDVKYFSWGATFKPGMFDTFKWPHGIIYAKEGENDGLVSVHSAMWGEYRGTLVGVNHLDLVGWVNTVRYVMAGWTGKPIAFKPATFYLEVADYLAEQGF